MRIQFVLRWQTGHGKSNLKEVGLKWKFKRENQIKEIKSNKEVLLKWETKLRN